MFSAPIADSMRFGAPSAGGIDLTHFGTVDLHSDRGKFRVIAHEDVARLLGQNAVESQTFRTGKMPAWYGGGS